MNAADREVVRIVLDQSDTPDDALGRKLVAASTGAYYPPERPEIDICLVCGLEGWGCVCDPCAPREEPTAEQLERARETRLMRAERNG
ncbi:MAG TPA: hypothetical protein VHW01_14575 [Polyangiaceae bacterium]|nr:hypothetical protein [Polyangiaceae bacterium]